MRNLAEDEKICPFCAETIKARAVKCRYCHSDLPVVDDTPRGPTTPVVPSVLEPAAGPVVAAPSRGAAANDDRRMVAALVVACLLLVAGGAWLLRDSAGENDVRDDGLRIGTHGQVVTPSFRDAAMRAAAHNAALLFSYSYRTLAQDEAAARAVTSPGFLAEYARVMQNATPKAVSAKLTLTAAAVATSLVSIEPDRAVALLFVNTVTTSGDSPKEQLDENRVLMRMTRKDGDWIVSKIDAF